MVKVLDCTLREGCQARQCNFNTEQSVLIAQEIGGLGVDMIEAGHPLISQEESDRVRAIVESSSVPVLAHARARREDIDAVIAVKAPWVGLFASVNPVSLETKFKGKSREDVLEMFSDTIAYAKSNGLKVRATIEDAARTQLVDLLSMTRIASSAGADRVCFADSVGALSPTETYNVLSTLVREFPDVTFEYHVHNDLGLSLANTLAAIDAGVEWHSTSCHGIGERAGITDTFQLIAYLANKKKEARFNLSRFGILSDLVEAFSRITLSPMHPIVGENAFNHVARLHQLAVKEKDDSYHSLNPEMFSKVASLSKHDPLVEERLFVEPFEKSATELKYHRHGPGKRFVMLDKRLLDASPYYFIARQFLDEGSLPMPGHVDGHTHKCDSVFLFLGADEDYKGLTVEVIVGSEKRTLESPATVFIPAGAHHTYRYLSGTGTYINFVHSGDYNSSLLEIPGREGQEFSHLQVSRDEKAHAVSA
ncbi:LeuA family protein [Pseudomonas lijiangensis]